MGTESRTAVRVFLGALWPTAPSGVLGLTQLSPPHTCWFTDIAEAAAHASGKLNLWVGVGTRKPGLSNGQRGGVADVTAIPGVWADLDVGTEGHKPGAKLPNPPTLADAHALLAAMPMLPTMIVGSGHGLQAYWLFREPWLCDAEQERERAAGLLEGWESLLRMKAEAHGWHLDKCANLDRMLRVPGTVNAKEGCPPVDCVLLEGPYEDRRYNPGDLEDLAPLPVGPVIDEDVKAPTEGNRPGEQWAAVTPWSEILEPHGWKYLYTRRDNTEAWRRPGKNEGQSATIGYKGRSTIYVFSNAAAPLEAGRSYGKFAAYALLNHDGDFGLAALTLRNEGFGADALPEPPEEPPQEPPPEMPAHMRTGAKEAVAAVAGQTSKPTRGPIVWTAIALLAAEFPAPIWVCPDLLPTGLATLGGRPKLGKSWLALQLSVAVATGGRFLDRPIEQGRALFIALEDSPRRMQSRLKALCGEGLNATQPDGLDVAFAWPALNGAGVAHLEAALRDHRLVVVDTLTRSMAAQVDWDAIGQVTAIMAVLQSMAQDANACVLLIDHHRKPNTQNPDGIDDLLGSTGKAAVSDTIWALYRKRGEHGATLTATGRDLEEACLNIDFDGPTHCWQATDAVTPAVKPGTVQSSILALLDKAPEGLRLLELAGLLGKNKGQVYRELGELLSKGCVVKDGTAYRGGRLI